jgi:hypothetical protein
VKGRHRRLVFDVPLVDLIIGGRAMRQERRES